MINVHISDKYSYMSADMLTKNCDMNIHQYRHIKDRSYLHMVKVNHEVNHGILACGWTTARLTSWLALTMCRKDRP